MEPITRKAVAEKLAAYLRHEVPLHSLVSWAESAMMDGEFDRRARIRAHVGGLRATSHSARLLRTSQHRRSVVFFLIALNNCPDQSPHLLTARFFRSAFTLISHLRLKIMAVGNAVILQGGAV